MRNGGAAVSTLWRRPSEIWTNITLRALETLKKVDLIACEDTRQTAKLLAHFEIRKRTVSYPRAQRDYARAPKIIIELEQGAQVALVSDAGNSGDFRSGGNRNGEPDAIRHGIKVVPLPGASAFVTALAASGMPIEEFTFIGFLACASDGAPASVCAPFRASRARWRSTKRRNRLVDTLEDALEIFGNRPSVIAREVTKMYEEFTRGHLEDLLAAVRAKPPRGEITLLIGQSDGEALPYSGTGRARQNAAGGARGANHEGKVAGQ